MPGLPGRGHAGLGLARLALAMHGKETKYA